MAITKKTKVKKKIVLKSLEERIRLRAFEIYSTRDILPGTAEEDWIRAEKELAVTVNRH